MGEYNFPCSTDHEQDWQPYPVDPFLYIYDGHRYINNVDSPDENVVQILNEHRGLRIVPTRRTVGSL